MSKVKRRARRVIGVAGMVFSSVVIHMILKGKDLQFDPVIFIIISAGLFITCLDMLLETEKSKVREKWMKKLEEREKRDRRRKRIYRSRRRSE